MTGVTKEERDNAVYVLPAGYSETEFELSEDEMAFDAFKAEAHDNDNYSKITVSRVPMNRHGQRGSQKLHFLFECAVDEYTFSQLLSKLRDEYKTGFYKIQARNARGQLKLNKTVAVEAPHGDTDTATGDGGTGAIIEQFSRSLAEQQSEMRDMMQSMIPSTNPMGSMKEMFETMGAMMGAMGINAQPPAAPKTLMEQLTEMKMVQELFSGDGSGAGGESNLFTLLTETVKSMGPALGLAIAAQTESGAIPSTGPILPALPNPEVEHQERNTLNAELETMRPQINFLVAQAKAGANPVDVANALIPGIPEESLESIEAFLQQENVIDICAQVNGEVNSYRQWFIEWREIMLKMLFEMFVDESDKIPPEKTDENLTLEPDEEQTPIVAGNDNESLDPGAASKSDDRDPDGPSPGNGGD